MGEQVFSGSRTEPPDGGLDASLLLMPMVKFCSPRDPRFLSTLEAIEAELVADSLVYRYPPGDGDGVRAKRGRSRSARSGTSRR